MIFEQKVIRKQLHNCRFSLSATFALAFLKNNIKNKKHILKGIYLNKSYLMRYVNSCIIHFALPQTGICNV